MPKSEKHESKGHLCLVCGASACCMAGVPRKNLWSNVLSYFAMRIDAVVTAGDTEHARWMRDLVQGLIEYVRRSRQVPRG